MCTLAHVLEAAGLATIALPSVLPVAERMRPPRALYCEFPLGRPLGKPDDPAFQTDVLLRAFSLLDATEPVLATHPEVIIADDQPMACAIPPRYDPELPAAVDEALGLRAAYDRALARRGATAVGKAVPADRVPDMLAILDRWAKGASWKDDPVPVTPIAVAHDIRNYYVEAGLELAEGPPPGARAAEEWFHSRTEAGKTLMAARAALREQGAPTPLWFYMAAGQR